MKLAVAIIAATITFGVATQAAEGDLEHNVGQGLGTLIFQGQNGLIQQVLAATTNGICGNQTFAITSGTLGAKQADSIVKNETINRFVAENMDNLARDIAIGRGETLSTLAVLMGVPQVQGDSFARELRMNFDLIYTSEDVSSIDVVKAISELRS